jgi:hypothetical protein
VDHLALVQRTPALVALSRDHHVALAHALRLRRAHDADVAVVVACFLAFLVEAGERHFAEEEQVLLPLVPADADAARRRVVDDHAEILRPARELGEAPVAPAACELGELLAGHVRFEERELFPLLERRLPADVLADVGRRLGHD